MPCGKPNCRCQATPPQLHGPYYQWTRKVRGKTVTVRLTEQQAERVRDWIENGRQLDRIVVEMETLSLRMTESACFVSSRLCDVARTVRKPPKNFSTRRVLQVPHYSGNNHYSGIPAPTRE